MFRLITGRKRQTGFASLRRNTARFVARLAAPMAASVTVNMLILAASQA
jgi:hypothetical protein